MAPTKKRSAFMEFAMDWKSKQIRRNKSFSISEAINEAGKIWKKMSDNEKMHYKDRAVTNGPLPVKEGVKKPTEKLTNLGIPISEILNKDREMEVTKRVTKKKIEDIVRSSRLNNNFNVQKYYFIMVNYFIKTNDTDNYIPAEIALTEFSLEGGVLNRFHSFVDPGEVLYGQVYQAQTLSQETHQLPLPPNAKGEKDFGKLYAEIMKFLSPETEGRNFEPPPLFTTEDYVPVIQRIMKYLQLDSFDTDIPEKVQILPMQYLFYTLKTNASEIGENEPPQSIYITDKILETDKYDYLDGIACDFHEEIDRTKYCALSCCVRWAYTFAENLCLDVAIFLKPGFHIPLDSSSYENNLKLEKKPLN